MRVNIEKERIHKTIFYPSIFTACDISYQFKLIFFHLFLSLKQYTKSRNIYHDVSAFLDYSGIMRYYYGIF